MKVPWSDTGSITKMHIEHYQHLDEKEELSKVEDGSGGEGEQQENFVWRQYMHFPGDLHGWWEE